MLIIVGVLETRMAFTKLNLAETEFSPGVFIHAEYGRRVSSECKGAGIESQKREIVSC